jgi:protein-tyrosine phosphatase
LPKVLFVCTGNICRSPTAEAGLRALAEKRGLADRLHIDSAGTTDYHAGEPPDRRAIAAANRRGLDLKALRARPLRPVDFENFDLIVAMDRGHESELRAMSPAAHAGKIKLYMDFLPPGRTRDVPDPYYGSARGFEEVLDTVEAGSAAILDAVMQKAE